MEWKQDFLFTDGHYLDSSATAQQLQVSLDGEAAWAQRGRANTGRGLYPLAQRADEMLERSREDVARFLGAAPNEIVFFPGATAAARALLYALREKHVALARFEHHATILPAMKWGKAVSWIELDKSGEINKDSLEDVLQGGAEVVVISHIANTIGGENDIAAIAKQAKAAGALLVVDGAQVPGRALARPGKMGADAYFFSGHKCYGPTGVGVLWARQKLLQSLPSLQLGGGTVTEVSASGFSLQKSPVAKHEGGTLPLAQIAGLAPALCWIRERETELIDHEASLAQRAREGIKGIGGEIMGDRSGPGPVSFRLPGVPGHDIAEIAARYEVALRAGRHCAHPMHDYIGWRESVRASFAAYNDEEDIVVLLQALRKAQSIFS